MRFRKRSFEPHKLAVALNACDTTHPVVGDMVLLAMSLRPDTVIDPVRRAATREHMLRAAEHAFCAGSPDAGSRDEDIDGAHVVEVVVGVHAVTMADVEKISDARAQSVADSLATLVADLADRT